MRAQVRWLRDWLMVPRPLARGGLIAVAFMLGLTLGGLVYVGARQFATADQQRQALHARDRELAAAIRRLDRLEHPSASDTRRALDRAIRRLSRAQAQALLKVLVRTAPPSLRRRAAALIVPPSRPRTVPVRGTPMGGHGERQTPGQPRRPTPQPPRPAPPRPVPRPRPPRPPAPLPEPAGNLVCPLLGPALPPQLGLC